MALYNLQNQKLQIIKEDSFKLEKDIQAITEKNLEYIFGLKFIKSEFCLDGGKSPWRGRRPVQLSL